MRITAIYDVDEVRGLGVTQIEAEDLADIYLSGGSIPGRLVSRTVELTAEDELTPEGERLMAEDELPGRYVRPGLRIVDGDLPDEGH